MTMLALLVLLGQVELTQTQAQALILRAEAPAYPPLARQARIQGTVRVRIRVAPDASAQGEILSGHPLLVPSVEKALRVWQFKPARQGYHFVQDFVFELVDQTQRILPRVQERAPWEDAADRGEWELAVAEYEERGSTPRKRLLFARIQLERGDWGSAYHHLALAYRAERDAGYRREMEELAERMGVRPLR